MRLGSEILLFAEDSLGDHLNHKRLGMLQAIEQYESNRLLNSNPEDLANYFAKTHEADAPTLDLDGITVGQGETTVDVSGSWEYGGWPGERTVVPGTRIALHIPYTGDMELLFYTASSRSYNPPRGSVERSEIIISYLAPQAALGGAKAHLDAELARLRQHLAWTQNDVAAFNQTLPQQARAAIDARRQRLLDNQQLVASLGYPLKHRPDAPRTYSVPEVRRKVVPAPPPASSAPFLPEPALDESIYEHILTVLANMVRVMEHSPEAFSHMGEQDLRTQFLVQLNGQFEGKATGETFHGSGKTDILLQEKDKSIFISECKFWDGPASLSRALDQLLDYVTWRDAKTAVLLFNRNKDFSGMLAQIPAVLESHPQLSGKVQTLDETVFRVRLRQRDDPPRELTCTILVFNVPIERSVSTRLAKRKP